MEPESKEDLGFPGISLFPFAWGSHKLEMTLNKKIEAVEGNSVFKKEFTF